MMVLNTLPLVLFLCVICRGYMLNCPSLPAHTAANVTDLRPGNIKVVLAMGDSITAAFGARGSAGGLTEYRGLSFSIGGDPNATTLANFLKFYSPLLQGPSLLEHGLEFCHGPRCPPFQYHPTEDVLNSAQSGAMITDLISHELDYLLRSMKANPNINMKEDWKLLTIFIGGNDLCNACNDTFWDPEEFEEHLIDTLEGIRANIPRVFVQVMEIFNVSQMYHYYYSIYPPTPLSLIVVIYDLSLKSPRCAEIHRVFSFECDCLFDKNADKNRQLMDTYAQQYNARSRAVALFYQSLNQPDFTVVTQPFGRNTALKNFPLDILTNLDCFHPSVIGHEAMAIALWNNLLSPAALKKTYLDLADTPLCPTADTLLYTT